MECWGGNDAPFPIAPFASDDGFRYRIIRSFNDKTYFLWVLLLRESLELAGVTTGFFNATYLICCRAVLGSVGAIRTTARRGRN